MTFDPKTYSKKANNFSVDLTTGSQNNAFVSILDSRSTQSALSAISVLKRWHQAKPQTVNVRVNLNNYELQMFRLQKKWSKLYSANVFILNKVSSA